MDGKAYCAECKEGIDKAVKKVDKHVTPKACFVWYKSKDNWAPIQGTGCAHWVAHQLNIRRGGPGERCLDGYTYRVKTLIGGMSIVKTENVKENDVYVTPTKDHTGLVKKVVAGASDTRTITIRHDSSRQGKVADNEFATYFKSKGTFYR